MATQEDHQRQLSRSIIRTPTPPLSPVAIQVTPSSHSQSHSRQQPLTPNVHLAPSKTSYNCAVTPSFASTSFGPSSTTSTTAVPTPIELPALPAPPLESETWDDLSPSAIESFDLGTLRSKLNLANQLIKTLSSSLSSLRTTATHYTLQHKLLMLENSEAAARHQVESDITRREVEVLRHDQSAWNTSQQTALVEENELYKRRLRRAKRSLREYREDLGELRDENEKLKKRIRDNRQHQHQLEASRSPGCPTSSSAAADQQQQQLKPRRETNDHGGPSRARLRNAPESDTNNEDDGLAALGLLASQVLSQEMVEEDPSSDHPHPHHHHHHNNSNHNPPHPHPHPPRLRKPRKQHHLPSITTALPSSAASSSQNIRPSLLSPLAFTTSSSTSTHQKRRRSRSRDSTISASEGEDEPPVPSSSDGNIKRRARVPLPPPMPVIDRLGSSAGGGSGSSPEKKKQKRSGVAHTPPPRKLPPGATPVSPPQRGKERDRTPGLP
ncbi:hypothetical protein L873DRAFT_1845379 [Choiromyces venosus 120613-1]|uniref:Uncharacterized protein n=1 Tax=Choiromyces venosus 120613-1 TaxID=1336337 RepID=A0A3N4JIC2_9PEZI|nr:hypothetical protein L873DRAFT_1845379 [Choiromyces venosus 120613-1]